MIDTVKRNEKPRNEYKPFADLLNRVVRVPHSEIKAKLEAEQKQKPAKKRASDQVSGEKD